MYDLILKGGRIYDGAGMPSFIGDVAISNGCIEEIGRINASADRVLDVGGLAVAPGIIDFHTHFDAQLWWDPLASSSHEHGVTTVAMGNCGLTLAPCKPESRVDRHLCAGRGYAARKLASRNSLGMDDARRISRCARAQTAWTERRHTHRPLRRAPIRHGRSERRTRGQRF